MAPYNSQTYPFRYSQGISPVRITTNSFPTVVSQTSALSLLPALSVALAPHQTVNLLIHAAPIMKSTRRIDHPTNLLHFQIPSTFFFNLKPFHMSNNIISLNHNLSRPIYTSVNVMLSTLSRAIYAALPVDTSLSTWSMIKNYFQTTAKWRYKICNQLKLPSITFN